jgi:hypothetical protein
LRAPFQNGLEASDSNEARYARVLPVVLVVGRTGLANVKVALMIFLIASWRFFSSAVALSD